MPAPVRANHLVEPPVDQFDVLACGQDDEDTLGGTHNPGCRGERQLLRQLIASPTHLVVSRVALLAPPIALVHDDRLTELHEWRHLMEVRMPGGARALLRRRREALVGAKQGRSSSHTRMRAKRRASCWLAPTGTDPT